MRKERDKEIKGGWLHVNTWLVRMFAGPCPEPDQRCLSPLLINLHLYFPG